MTSQRPGQRAYPYSRRLAPAEVDQAADDYVASLDRRQYVGKRHHIVPRFILARFANSREQVWVRDRVTDTETDTGGLRNVKDLAIRDFYTFVDKSGELDSSFESLLGEVETTADKVLKAHIDNSF